jgi:hypothetical protein
MAPRTAPELSPRGQGALPGSPASATTNRSTTFDRRSVPCSNCQSSTRVRGRAGDRPTGVRAADQVRSRTASATPVTAVHTGGIRDEPEQSFPFGGRYQPFDVQ